MLNDRGGVNGRKVNFISLDNGSNNGKSVDLAPAGTGWRFAAFWLPSDRKQPARWQGMGASRFRDQRAKPGRQT
jgi:hypothetical protein